MVNTVKTQSYDFSYQIRSLKPLPGKMVTQQGFIVKEKQTLKLDLSTIAKMKRGEYNIYDGLKVVGVIRISLNHIVIHLSDSVHVQLLSSIKIPAVTIITKGDVEIIDDLIAEHSIDVTAQNFLGNKLQASYVTIQCEQKIVCTKAVYATNSIYFTANNANLAGPLRADYIELDCENTLLNEKSIRGAISCKLTGGTIHSKSTITSERVQLHATHQIEFNDKISASKRCKIQAPKLIENGNLEVKGKLKLLVGETIIAPAARIHSRTKLKFIGSKLSSSGHLIFENSALITLKEALVSGELQLPNITYLHVEKLTISDRGSLGWFEKKQVDGYPPSLTRIIKINDDLVVEPNAVMHLQQSLLTTKNMLLLGKLNANFSALYAERSTLHGELKICSSEVTVVKTFSADNFIAINLKNTHLNVGVADLKGSGNLTVNQSQLDGKVIKVAVPSSFDNTLVRTDFVNFDNQAAIKHCQFEVENSFLQKQHGSLTVSATKMQTKSMSLIETTIIGSEITIDSLQILKKTRLTNSIVTGNKITTAKQAELIVSGAKITASYLCNDGKNSFSNNSMLSTTNLVNHGDYSSQQTKLTCARDIMSDGGFNLNESLLISDSFHLKGKHTLKDSEISSSMADIKSTGVIDNCALKFEILRTAPELSLQVNQSIIFAEYLNTDKNLSLSESQVRTNVLYQAANARTTANSSAVEATKAWLSNRSSTLSLTNNSLVTSELGVFNGQVTTNKTVLSIKNIVFNNETILKHTTVGIIAKQDNGKQVLESINSFCSKQSQRYINANIISREGWLSNNTCVSEKTLLKFGDLFVAEAGSLIAKKSAINVANQLVASGSIGLEHSQMIVDSLSTFKKLDLKNKSQLTAKKPYYQDAKSKLSAEKSLLELRRADLFGTTAMTKSQLAASQDLVFYKKSAANIEQSQIQANEYFILNSGVSLKGNAAALSAEDFFNDGSIAVDTLGIKAKNFDNSNGMLNGGKALQFQVDHCLTNYCGSIQADSIQISTAMIFNMADNIIGRNHLTINSLLNMNLLGSYRSYNANINSFFYGNMGLVLSCLPTSMKAAFSDEHLITGSRALLSNLFPDAKNTINLAYQAAPIGWRAVKSVYRMGKQVAHVVMNKNALWSDALPPEYRYFVNTSFSQMASDARSKISSFKMCDVVPGLLAVKGLTVAGTNFYGACTGVETELNDWSWIKHQDSFMQVFNELDAGNFLRGVGSVFGPSMVRNSLFSTNMGVNAFANILADDLLSFNSGVNYGAVSLNHTAKWMLNEGVIAGDQVNLQGQLLKNDGYIANSHKMHLNFDTIHNLQSGSISSHHGKLGARAVINDGKLNVSDKTLLITENINNSKTGNLKATDSTVKSTVIENTGQLASNQSYVGCQILKNNATGNIPATGSYIKIEQQITNEGHVALNDGVLQADKFYNEQGATVTAHTVDVTTKLLINNGAETFEQVILTGDSHVSTGSASLINVQANLDTLSLQGQNALANTSVTASTATLGMQSNTHTTNSEIHAKDITASGMAQHNGYIGFIADNTLTTANTSTIKAESTDGSNVLVLKGQYGNLNGTVIADKAVVDFAIISNAVDLVMRKGKYSSFHVHNDFELTVRQDLTIGAIDRSCGLDLTANSVTMNTGYSTAHSLSVKSTTGNIKLYGAHYEATNLYIDSANSIYVSGNIGVNNVAAFKAKSDFANLAGNVYGNLIFVEAGRIINYDAKTQFLSHLLSELRKQVGTGGVIHGNQVYLEATGSDILNYGGKLEGDLKLQGIAENIILNHANEELIYNKKGKLENVKFKGAVISGGTGLGEDQVGLYLQSGGRTINNGSTLESRANNFIHAKSGFFSSPLHQTISHSKKESNWYGTTRTKTWTETRLQVANVIAAGKNIIITENDKCQAVATNFITKDGTQIYAKGDIELYSLTFTDKTEKSKEYGWGIYESTKKKKNENAVPVLIYDSGVSRLESKEGNIISRGLIALGDGDFIAIARNGSVSFVADKLSRSIKSKSQGFSISLPALDLFKSGVRNYLNSLDPSIGKIDALLRSQNAAELATNGWNAAISGYNSYVTWQNAFSQYNIEGLVADRIGATSLLNPTINCSYHDSMLMGNYEILGPGLFQRRSFLIGAKDDVAIEGVDLEIAKDVQVKAHNLKLLGVGLQANSSFKQQATTVGVNMTGSITHASHSACSGSSKSTHYQNQKTNIGGSLHVEVENMSLIATNVNVESISGEVRQELHTASKQDSDKSKNESYSASSTGAVSYHRHTSISRTTTRATSLHVRSDIDESFQVNKVLNEGAKITTDGINKLNPNEITNKTIKDYNTSSGFGFNANVSQLVQACQSQQTGITTGSNQAHTSTQLSTMNVSYKSKKLRATQTATYYGAKGTDIRADKIQGKMNTQNNDGYQVLKDGYTNITLDIPLNTPDVLGQRAAPQPSIVRDIQEPTSIATPNSNEDGIGKSMELNLAPGITVELASTETRSEKVITVSTDPETEQDEVVDPFNPKISMSRLTTKTGGGGKAQLSKHTSGQYTTVKKEIKNSVDNNQLTNQVEITLVREGNKGKGAYYEANIDPVKQQIIVDMGAGYQARVNIASQNIDYDNLGSLKFAVDAASMELLLRANMTANNTHASASIGGSAGIMGPSVNGQITSPELRLCGFTFKITVEGGAGVGIKGAINAGASANASKAKVSTFAGVGLFAGAGAQSRVKVEVGLDTKMAQAIDGSFKEMIAEDPLASSIIDKMKRHEYCTPAEIEHLDYFTDQVNVRAGAKSWSN